MTITEDTITGRELLNKCTVTAIQNSRRNSDGCPALLRQIIKTWCFCAQYI